MWLIFWLFWLLVGTLFKFYFSSKSQKKHVPNVMRKCSKNLIVSAYVIIFVSVRAPSYDFIHFLQWIHLFITSLFLCSLIFCIPCMRKENNALIPFLFWFYCSTVGVRGKDERSCIWKIKASQSTAENRRRRTSGFDVHLSLANN